MQQSKYDAVATSPTTSKFDDASIPCGLWPRSPVGLNVYQTKLLQTFGEPLDRVGRWASTALSSHHLEFTHLQLCRFELGHGMVSWIGRGVVVAGAHVGRVGRARRWKCRRRDPATRWGV